MKKDYKGIDMKPDALCHKGPKDDFAKDAKLPGQMYVPKHVSNEGIDPEKQYTERRDRY